MEFVPYLTVLLVAGGTWPLLAEFLRAHPAPGARRAALTLWALLPLGVLAVALFAREPALALRTADVRPREVDSDGYVSSDACRACHPGEYASWYATYHRTMSALASAEHVRAPFDGRELGQGDEAFTVFKKGDEFWVALRDPYWQGSGRAPRVERRVVQVTGSHHQQLYWFESGRTRALGLLSYGYRIDDASWRPIGSIFLTPPRGGQSRTLGRWNTSCQKCHATHGKPRFKSTAEMETEVTELGIACEMCHGPGAEHVAANRDPLRRLDFYLGDEDEPSMVDPRDLDHRRSAQVCGQCHGVMHLASDEERRAWVEHGFSYRPGEDLFASRTLGEPDADKYERKFWSDGELRVTGREYNSLERTGCFQRGEMSCLSCHRLHQASDDPRPVEEWRVDLLAEGMGGDRACTQCHAQFDAPAALAAHTHHAPESSGSRCLDCHMPYTTYGLMGAIRNHEVRPPSVAASLATGRPNACNQCHLDRTLAWTAEHLSAWYGLESPALGADERTVAASVLWTLTGDAGQRALMAWNFGWEPALAASGRDWRVPYLAELLTDPYHTVRFRAHRSLGAAPELAGLDYDYLAPEEERTRLAQAVRARWAAAALPGARPALLLGADGRELDGERARLLERRDNSDMVLQE